MSNGSVGLLAEAGTRSRCVCAERCSCVQISNVPGCVRATHDRYRRPFRESSLLTRRDGRGAAGKVVSARTDSPPMVLHCVINAWKACRNVQDWILGDAASPRPGWDSPVYDSVCLGLLHRQCDMDQMPGWSREWSKMLLKAESRLQAWQVDCRQ
jgi:hypothetical protein